MKRLVTTTILLGLTTLFLWAVPAKRTVTTYTQPDGSTVSVMLQGDEHFHYCATTDGVMVSKDHDGYFKYTVINDAGNLIAGKYIARNPEKRTREETEYIAAGKQKMKAAVKNQRAKAASKRVAAKAGKFPNTGQVKGLIILAQFKDNTFSANGTNEQFTRMMNEENYGDYGATGSARDYFLAQSNNLFQPDFTVAGPVTLPQNMAYYGANASDIQGNDQNPRQMVIDACRAANAEVDFSDYDLDGDGKVDLIYIIYAGYGEAQGGGNLPNTIWPHAYGLGNRSIILDGTIIDRYACSCELSGDRGRNLDGIGTFCHEFSHCLGFPDVYDTSYGGGFGMDAWDVMDYGSYNNDSKTPAGYSAYEKAFLGWIELEELPKGSHTLAPFSTSNKAYKITSPYNENEFFTFENRQNIGWDAELPGHGLIVTHFDYDESVWGANIVNNDINHPRWQIVPANGLLSFNPNDYPGYIRVLKGQSYPGTGAVTSIESFSVYTDTELYRPVTNIVEADNTITFDFMDGVLEAPKALPATDIFSTGFTANWEAVAEAESYMLEVKEIPSGELLVSEDFSKFKEGTVDKPNDVNIYNKLDTYMQTAEWTGEQIYQAGGACKLANTFQPGKLTTPPLDLSASSGTVTIFMKVSGKKAGVVNISSSATVKQAIGITTDEQEVSCTLETGLNTARITIASDKNNATFIYDIAVYSGRVEKIGNDFREITVPGTETSYEVTDLEANSTYQYSIKAQAESKESAFSKRIKVNLTPTSLDCCSLPKAYSSIYTDAHEIVIVAAENTMANIYSVDGMLKRSVMIKQGDNRIKMPNGIYIIRIGESSKKIIISAE